MENRGRTGLSCFSTSHNHFFSVLEPPSGSLNEMFCDDAYPGEDVQQMASKLKFRVVLTVFGSHLVLRAGGAEILQTSVY